VTESPPEPSTTKLRAALVSKVERVLSARPPKGEAPAAGAREIDDRRARTAIDATIYRAADVAGPIHALRADQQVG
jgi:hypothetical protein